MTKLLEQAVEEVRSLLEDEQDRAVQALIAFARDHHDYQLDAALERLECSVAVHKEGTGSWETGSGLESSVPP